MSLTVQQALSSLEFGRHLPENVLHELAKIASLQAFEASECIFDEGEVHDAFGILVEGHVVLKMHVPGRGEVKILSLAPGDMLGWSALVGEGRMTASAHAIDDLQLLMFPGNQIRQLAQQDHEVGYSLFQRVAAALSRRLHATRLQLLDLYGSSRLPVDPHRHSASESPPVY